MARGRLSLRRAHAKSELLVHEMAKFGLVGGFNYVLDVGLFNVLILGPLGGQPLVAKTISTVVSVTSSYFLNRHWTFRHRPGAGRPRDYGVFVLLSAGGLAIALACLAFSEYVLGLHGVVARNVAGNVVGVALAMVFRFWSFKRWVFLTPEPLREEGADDAADRAVRSAV